MTAQGAGISPGPATVGSPEGAPDGDPSAAAGDAGLWARSAYPGAFPEAILHVFTNEMLSPRQISKSGTLGSVITENGISKNVISKNAVIDGDYILITEPTAW